MAVNNGEKFKALTQNLLTGLSGPGVRIPPLSAINALRNQGFFIAWSFEQSFLIFLQPLQGHRCFQSVIVINHKQPSSNFNAIDFE